MQTMAEADLQLAQVFEQLVRVMRRLSTAGDLTPPAAATLNRVATDGPRRLTDLAAGEGLSQPGMTQLVTRLERDGLVRRAPSDADGRVVLIEVTDAGRAVVSARRIQRADALGALLDCLGHDDRAAIRAAVPALGRLTSLAVDAAAASA
jgi:DNA-binding MarR family transcriptional regulator